MNVLETLIGHTKWLKAVFRMSSDFWSLTAIFHGTYWAKRTIFDSFAGTSTVLRSFLATNGSTSEMDVIAWFYNVNGDNYNDVAFDKRRPCDSKSLVCSTTRTLANISNDSEINSILRMRSLTSFLVNIVVKRKEFAIVIEHA